MKKYTAKFLPVEGQVKEGDTYLSKWRQEHKFFHYSTCAKIENGKVFPIEGVGSREGMDISDIVSKVKPFLFSIEDNKQIGQISDDAIFVKEGDTFEENQWQLCIKNEKENWLSVDKNADWSHWINTIRIKCDKCETFH